MNKNQLKLEAPDEQLMLDDGPEQLKLEAPESAEGELIRMLADDFKAQKLVVLDEDGDE